MLIQLYKNHSVWIAQGIKITKSKYRAEDLVQEMYLKVGEKQPNIDFDKNYKGYINRLMKNIYLNRKFKESKRILVDITEFKEYL